MEAVRQTPDPDGCSPQRGRRRAVGRVRLRQGRMDRARESVKEWSAAPSTSDTADDRCPARGPEGRGPTLLDHAEDADLRLLEAAPSRTGTDGEGGDRCRP